jgi:hypothetical protein
MDAFTRAHTHNGNSSCGTHPHARMHAPAHTRSHVITHTLFHTRTRTRTRNGHTGGGVVTTAPTGINVGRRRRSCAWRAVCVCVCVCARARVRAPARACAILQCASLNAVQCTDTPTHESISARTNSTTRAHTRTHQLRHTDTSAAADVSVCGREWHGPT